MPRKIPPPFEALCQRRISPCLNIAGYRQDQKHEMVMQITFALLLAGLADKVVADSRSTANALARQRASLWDALEDEGWCRKCVGSEASKKVTRYRATKKLMGLRPSWSGKLLRVPPEPPDGRLLGLVRFKHKLNDKKHDIPFDLVIRHYAPRQANGQPDPQAVSTGIAITRVVEEFLNQINSENLNHSWKTTNKAGVFFQPSVELVQLHIGELWRMTRLYTQGEIGGQSIPKEARARMRIDGEPVTELDISGSIPRLLYHLKGFAVPARVDIYAPHRVVPEVWPFLKGDDRKTVRDFIKKATMICFNTPRRASAIGGVVKQFREHPDRDRWPLSDFPSPPELVTRIARMHHRISGYLFANHGPKLVTIEGQIMLHVLRRFVLEAKKPALPIHDGLVVRQSDSEFAQAVMEQAYFGRTGFLPVIKIKSPA